MRTQPLKKGTLVVVRPGEDRALGVGWPLMKNRIYVVSKEEHTADFFVYLEGDDGKSYASKRLEVIENPTKLEKIIYGV